MKRAAYFLSACGGATILFCAVLVALDIVGRDVFGVSRFFSFEITSYVYAFVISLAYADALWAKRHIRIDVLYQRFPVPVQRTFDVLALVGMSLLAFALAYYGVRVAVESFRMGAKSATTLSMPMYIPQAFWAVALVWFAVSCIVLLGICLRRIAQRRFADLDNLAGVLTEEDREL